MIDRLTYKSKTLQGRIVSGSVILLSGSGAATAVNLIYNVLIARCLGPNGFGQATVVYTLLTILSAVTLAFQLASSKVVAQQNSPAAKAAAYRAFHRSSWMCGLLVAFVLLLFQKQISDYLQLRDPLLVALLAIGAAFYVPLGSRRGYMQGICNFPRSAINLALEGVARLAGSYAMILAGYGVRGVIAANSAAILVAYFAMAPKLAARAPNPVRAESAFRETSQALLFFSSQMLINNCDIVLVKHFFPAGAAGLYAAVAIVGRVVYSLSSAVVNSTFPLVAGTQQEERKDLRVIATSLLLVMCLGLAVALGLWFAPAGLWTALLGSGFTITGKYTLSYFLTLYALKTVIYSLSVVIITFEMSYKIANTSWVHLACTALVIACICRFHDSMREVILVQMGLMVALLVLVAMPFLLESLADAKRSRFEVLDFRPLRLARRVSEDEVIAAFLNSDFHCAIYEDYREKLGNIVARPNFQDADENAKRRALLFLRQLSLWTEIPGGTEWFEAEIDQRDLERIRVFPRAQWRNVAGGDFRIERVMEGMRTHRSLLDASFLAKIDAIGERVTQENSELGAVIAIGMNEGGPLTAVDGNHRLVASLLASPCGLPRLRFLCGFSPRMAECCWYNTTLANLFRYGRNMLKHSPRNPKAELDRLLQVEDWIEPSESRPLADVKDVGFS
ncbi:MAG: lipopolysaccharide biosynthesis protein [Terracidiphilus sp.]